MYISVGSLVAKLTVYSEDVEMSPAPELRTEEIEVCWITLFALLTLMIRYKNTCMNILSILKFGDLMW